MNARPSTATAPTPRQSTQLPNAPRKRRRDFGQLFARAFCLLLAVVGVLPVAGTLVVRSAWARRWASRETERVLRQQGIDARYEVGVRLWPLAVELTNLQVSSSDGGAPALVADRVSARPKFFALLGGKLVVQEIEASAPRVRLVMRQGQIANLDVKLNDTSDKTEKKPFHAPFGVVSVTDAVVDLDIDGVRVSAQELDADVTVDDDRDRGSSFEVAVRLAHAQLHRRRVTFPQGDDKPAVVEVDDDALCAVDARARIEPQLVLVRRFEATGSADMDDAEATLPKCDLPLDDKRRVELSLAHLRVRLPEKAGDLPRADGHVKARFPLGLVERLAELPQTDGWLGFDFDLRFAEDTTIPDANGHFEAHGIQLDRYRFAHEIQSDLSVRRNVVSSPKTTLRIADGLATITDVVVEPLAKGVPMRAKLEVRDASFAALMKDLGVTQHPHVGWDLREVHVPMMQGTLVPLKLDGELTARTPNLFISDAALDAPVHARIISFHEASLATHVAIRPDALEFHNVSASVGKGSKISGGLVSIGFHNDLLVDVDKAEVKLEDIGPLATIPIAGDAVVTEAHVKGKFNDPHLEAEATIQGFVLGDIPFGNVTAAHVAFAGDVVDLTAVKAQKGKSDYEMPTARLDFGKHAGLAMDAVATSSALGLRDFFAIWKMEEDPRFTELDGSIATKANLHIALGGPEDVCGGGFIDVRATAHVKDVKIYGETFDDGDVDLEYKWTDRLAGMEGADVDIRAVTLHKSHPAGGSPVGSVLGSGAIQRGGELRGSVVVEALPLSRIDQLGSFRRQVEGSLSGIAQVSGRMDAWSVAGDLDVTPIRVRGAGFGSSHLRVGMTQKPPAQGPISHTRCGGRIFAPFDKDAYLRDTSTQGTLTVDGDLLGGTVRLEKFAMTREKGPLVTGRAVLRKLDLGAVSAVALGAAPNDEEDANPNAIAGELSGDLAITRLKLDDLGTTQARFAPTALVVQRGGQKLQMRPAPVNFVVENDGLIVPPLVFDVNAQNGLKGSFIVRGDISRLTREANLNLTAELLPMDLGFLVGVVPKVERAAGTLSGMVKVGGTATTPTLDGAVKIKDGELAIHGVPGVISDIDIDVRADANEVRVSRASAHFLGGTISVSDARVPLKERAFGVADAQLVLRGIHVTPAEGVNATLDAELAVSYNAQATGSADARLPHVTGDVLLTSFDYTRPINLLNDISGFKVGGARRTVVETYDPSQDAVVFDVRVRTRSPLRIRNNLVETQLAIDSGTLTVTGTNQRVGLRGDLKALPGGRIRLLANEFEIRQALIRFDDPTRIAPSVDIIALTEYRRYTDTSAGAAAGASAADVGAAGGGGSGRVGGLWRISIHAYGDADNVRVDMTSDPALAQEDIVLLLTLGLTRSEIDQVQAGVGTSLAFQAAGTVTGADRAVKEAIPVIDDFRFGSQYSSRTGRTEPQVTVGKRFTDQLRGTVSTGLSEDRELRSNIEWRLNNRLSLQGTYDNINDVSSSVVGNVGGGFRWRIEFE